MNDFDLSNWFLIIKLYLIIIIDRHALYFTLRIPEIILTHVV